MEILYVQFKIIEFLKNVRFDVLTALRMTMLFFQALIPCRLAGRFHCFIPEDGGSMFLRIVGL
jgi:hypothetical protein